MSNTNQTKPPLALNAGGDPKATQQQNSEQSPEPESKRTVARERFRPTIADGSASRFAVNPDRIPDDVEYRWVRVQIEGTEDNDNYDKALMNGWLEVPASRHPELVLQRLGRDAPAADGPIMRAGHILMDIPKQIAVDRREIQRRENVDRIQSIEHTLVDGAPSTFYTEKNTVTTSRGVSFQS